MNNNVIKSEAVGVLPIISIVDIAYKQKAIEVANYLKSLELTGVKTKANRDEIECKKDLEATEFLKKLAKANDPVLAYGFMLYNETGIVKQYWAKRCGKLRKDKKAFFRTDEYLDWLENIYIFLIGEHENLKNILYYYRLDGEGGDRKCSNYDVMNSFRVYWNLYFLPILAQWMFKQEAKAYKLDTISIEEAAEGLDSGRRLEKEISRSMKTLSPFQLIVFEEIEGVLREFTKGVWAKPINPTSKAGSVSYLDVLRSIVSLSVNSLSDMRKKLNLSQSVTDSAIVKIRNYLERNNISFEDLASYLSKYGYIASQILSGSTLASFKNN